jgi:hypothetical protein
MDQADYFVGLDLGQAADPTALAVVERRPVPPAPLTPEEAWGLPSPPACKPSPWTYRIPYLHRWELNTPYPQIVRDVADLLNKRKSGDPNRAPLRGCRLLVDGTGVGRPVVDLVREARLPCRLMAVTITAGRKVEFEAGYVHVPKADLVGALQSMLGRRLLTWPGKMPLADLLVKELGNFRVKLTKSANETFKAWREGDHDDLVLAAALAAWGALREPGDEGEPFCLYQRGQG